MSQFRMCLVISACVVGLAVANAVANWLALHPQVLLFPSIIGALAVFAALIFETARPR